MAGRIPKGVAEEPEELAWTHFEQPGEIHETQLATQICADASG
jgi:hypothetical protein